MKKIMCIFMALLFIAGCSSGNSNSQSNTASQTSASNASSEKSDVFSASDFTIEEISVRNEAELSFYHTKIKVRNNTDHYINNMKIRYQILDSKNDVLADGDYYVSDLDANTAMTVEDQATKGDGDFSKVAAYKFVNVEVREYDDTKLHETYRYKDPIIIEVKDFGTYSK